ncbi:MAG TPA: TrbC/VirB2 family protein [Clostridia bacterium]|nr:TrbC/VirB2 family protein [Clostridia bacterium]
MLRKVDKIAKITATILLVLMILTMVTTSAFAWSVSVTPNTQASGANTITGIGNGVVGIVQVIGYVVAVVMLVIIGIKYITSSPEGKAEVKKTALFYVLGAVLIAGAVTIVGAVFDFGSTVS